MTLSIASQAICACYSGATMITLRAAKERGHANHGWLDSHHSFSFAGYYDPEHMGVSALRVINDDVVAAGAGFSTHSHSDMEIISYVLKGALEHRDNMGNGSIIRPGEVQRMSAGSGISHSEYNASQTEQVNFLQIWIMPNQYGVEPGYAQKDFTAELNDRLCLVASPDGREGSLSIHADVLLYASRIKTDDVLQYPLQHGRTAYLHLATGEAIVNGVHIHGGDGITIKDETAVEINTEQQAELLLFDLP